MKVALLNDVIAVPYGGGPMFFFHVRNMLERVGIECQLFGWGDIAGKADPGKDTITFDWDMPADVVADILNENYDFVWWMCVASKMAKLSKYDLQYDISKDLKIPFGITFHNKFSYDNYGPKAKRLFDLEKFILAMPHDQGLTDIGKSKNLFKEHTHVEHFGVPYEPLWPVNIDKKEKLIVNASRFVRYKRPELLVNMMRYLPDWEARIYSWPPIWDYTDWAKPIMDSAPDNVKFPGKYAPQDLDKVYGSATFTTDLDNMFLHIVQYVSLQGISYNCCPIVITDGDRWSETPLDASNCIMFEEEDTSEPEYMAEQLVDAYELGFDNRIKNAKNTILPYYSYERVGKRCKAILERYV